MSVKFSVYIGPYLIVPKLSGFDIDAWSAIVRDGRGATDSDESDWILIPDCKPDGVKRQMQFHQDTECNVESINPATIVREMAAFSRLTSELVQWCDDHSIEAHEVWGVVPCRF